MPKRRDATLEWLLRRTLRHLHRGGVRLPRGFAAFLRRELQQAFEVGAIRERMHALAAIDQAAVNALLFSGPVEALTTVRDRVTSRSVTETSQQLPLCDVEGVLMDC